MMKQHKKKLILILIIMIVISIIGGFFIYQNLQESKVEEIKTVSNIDTNINTDDGDLKVDWSNLPEKEITSQQDITITQEGSYHLTGKLEGTVTIKSSGNIKLILDNVEINSTNGPAIYIEEAANTLIYLKENTTNILKDSTKYSYNDEDINSVIYSKDDLIFDGTGTLIVNGNYQDGIVSKDDLKIIDGTYQITSEDDGIKGKDSVYILDGNFDITSGGDGIKSTNDTEEEKGYILIKKGNFKIISELDGIDAKNKLVIEDGTFDIKTGGGSSNSSLSNNWGMWGTKSVQTTSLSSAKGLKAENNLVIQNGNFTLNTSDDSIHSNNDIGIKSGVFTISSGDDGIHADTELIIDDGTIDITQSYEGIESSKMTINNGKIHIIASDDGINVAGGNDSSSMNRPGQNNYSNNTNHTLTINNGDIYVNSKGDGIDINGSGSIYGGYIIVDGPTDNGNGAIDYDGNFIVDGGTLIAVGSNGMLQGISSTKQYNATIAFSTNHLENTKVTIVDSNNQEIISYTPTKSFSSIILSSNLLKKDETYTVKVEEETITFTTDSFSTIVGTRQNMNPGQNKNDRRPVR